MKRRTIITSVLAVFLLSVIPAIAQEEDNGEHQLSNGEHQLSNGEHQLSNGEHQLSGFKKFNVREDFTENGFQWFHNAELLAAGDKEKSNAMTIGWGGIGTLWGRTALTVYVAEKRYTKEFMDKAEYFTVMAFDVEQSKVLNYMGTKSGRDGDKAQALGLHTAYTVNGTPYYTEATMVIECKIMYAAPFDPQYFKSDAPKKMYANFPAGIHSMYIGEVINAWRK